jgi:hypothetical protein
MCPLICPLNFALSTDATNNISRILWGSSFAADIVDREQLPMVASGEMLRNRRNVHG